MGEPLLPEVYADMSFMGVVVTRRRSLRMVGGKEIK